MRPTGSTILVIKSLSTKTEISKVNKITSIELLGHGPVKWERTENALNITLPETLPNDWALSFKINVDGELDKSEPPYDEKLMKLPEQT